MPDLARYDWIALSSSAGKDSQAMIDYVVELADDQGVSERVVVVHADLGEVEWDGTGELAREQAAAYGLRFEHTTRIGGTSKVDGKVYRRGEQYGSLLDYAERRGAWPSNQQRWCTSDFKRGPIMRVFTSLAQEWRARTGEQRPCRILDCQGLRAEESPARAKKPRFAERKRSTTQHVDTWLPLLDWCERDVWARIQRSGVRYHYAYDLGMPRLSCALCIFAPRAALVLAGRHNRELLERYVEVERRTGHTFRVDLSLEEVAEEVDRGAAPDPAEMDAAWNM